MKKYKILIYIIIYHSFIVPLYSLAVIETSSKSRESFIVPHSELLETEDDFTVTITSNANNDEYTKVLQPYEVEILKEAILSSQYRHILKSWKCYKISFKNENIELTYLTDGEVFNSNSDHFEFQIDLDFLFPFSCYPSEEHGVIKDAQVRLRSKPSLDGEILERLNTGDEVTVIGKTVKKYQIGAMEDYWYKVNKVKEGGYPTGWVHGAFIDFAEGVNSESPERHGVVNDERVKLRNHPRLDAETLEHLNTGEEVLVIGKTIEKYQVGDMENYWYRVKRVNTVGWIYGAFIDFIVEDTEEMPDVDLTDITAATDDKNTTIPWIIGGVALLLGALITVIIMKKKKT